MMNNINQNNDKSKNIQNLRTIIDRFSKGARKGKLVLGAAMAGAMLSSCTPIPINIKYTEAKAETLEEDEEKLHKPYSKKIGNTKAYTFHNYIGEEPSIYTGTAEADADYYLNEGVSYLQSQFNEFYQTLSNRPGLQQYFAQYNSDFTNLPIRHGHRETTANEKMDYLVNKISDTCIPILTEIANCSYNNADRKAFILCYRVLANENYKEAIGNARDNNNNDMMRKYNTEQAYISALWPQNDVLKSVPLNKDIYLDLDKFKYNRITAVMHTLLSKSNPKICSNPLLQDITVEDLENVISLSLNARSITAMHDYVSTMSTHENCQMNDQIIQSLQQTKVTTKVNNDLTI